MSEKRLMKTEEEVRKRAKELLLLPKEDLLTQYMFQEQEIEELEAKLEMYENGVYFSSENDKLQKRIDKAAEHLKEVMKDEEEYEEDYIYNKYLLDILQGSEKE